MPGDTGGSSLREIGDALRRAGLTQNALLAWAGTHRLSALSRIVTALAARPIMPASAALALFVAGADVPLARLRGVPIDALVAHGLVKLRAATAGAFVAHDARAREPGHARETAIPPGDHARARVAILPLEQTLVVCDRFDAPPTRELVLCPDDSSYHLASAIGPGRRDRWIDLATGSAFAPLARPALATQIAGIDLNPRASEFARLGATLSGCAHIAARCGDIGEAAHNAHDDAARSAHHDAARSEHRDVVRSEHDAGSSRAQLVTCNAPILGDPDPAMWRSTDRAFFDRMWRAARACVAPGGEVIVHCVLDGVPVELDGDVTIVIYTPASERAYCIVWWTPDAPARRVIGHRALTAARPHVDPRDRDDARAGVLDTL